MNLANILTIVRLLLILPFVLFFKLQFGVYLFVILTLLIFIIAYITDFIDGMIARKTDTVTEFGQVFDPIADKLLSMAHLLVIFNQGKLPILILALFILREIFVTALRVESNVIMPASNYGKYKTIALAIAQTIIILFPYSTILNTVLLLPALALSIISAYDYYKAVSTTKLDMRLLMQIVRFICVPVLIFMPYTPSVWSILSSLSSIGLNFASNAFESNFAVANSLNAVSSLFSFGSYFSGFSIIVVLLVSLFGYAYLSKNGTVDLGSTLFNAIYSIIDEVIIIIVIIKYGSFAIPYLMLFFIEYGVRNMRKIGMAKTSFYDKKIYITYALLILNSLIPILSLLFMITLIVVNIINLYIFYKEQK